MIRLIVAGCFGRLGSAVCKVAAETPGMEIAAGTDAVENPGAAAPAFPVYPGISQCAEPADVMICCERPTAEDRLLAVLSHCAAKKIPLVLCTTGMSAEAEAAISKTAESIAVLRSANMSLGINLLSSLLKRVSPLLHSAGFDIEIIEKHHNQKLDAPSGTALLLANSINSALGGEMKYVYDRSNAHEKRTRDGIGLHALRGGTIVGEHSAVFAGRDEVIELTHIAASREVFAVGTVKAAEFIHEKPAGVYTMQDLFEI